MTPVFLVAPAVSHAILSQLAPSVPLEQPESALPVAPVLLELTSAKTWEPFNACLVIPTVENVRSQALSAPAASTDSTLSTSPASAHLTSSPLIMLTASAVELAAASA